MGTCPVWLCIHCYLTLEVLTDNRESASMTMRHKGTNNIGVYVETKEGERGPLCRNKANVRSPSLASDKYIFSQETVTALSELGEVLRRIRRRLQSEGINIYDDDN